MRKLMWFTMGFSAACLFCAYSWICEGLIVPAVFLACLAAIGLLFGKKISWLRCACVALLGISAGLCWFQGYARWYLDSPVVLDGKVADAEVRCIDYSYSTDYGTAVDGFLYIEGKPYLGKFYVNGDINMEPGDLLTGCFDFRVTTQDSEKGATYHQSKGILLLGYQEEDAQLRRAEDKPIWAVPAMLRNSLLETISHYFPEDTAGFAKALLLGDRSDLSYSLNTAFRISGIMHIIAVSGLHVTILFTLINLLCLKRRTLVALLGIPSLILFAAVAGFTPSVIRACIMQSLMILATLFSREYDGPTELSSAALAMLIVNPLVITSVSFQLSVGCMIGIFLFQKPIYNWLCEIVHFRKGSLFGRVWTGFSGSVSVTVSAISLTTPLSAYYFGAVSIVGVLTNLLTLWAVSFVFYGIVLVCLAGSLLPSVSSAVAFAVSFLIRYIILMAEALAAIPFAAVYTVSVYIVAWVVFCYILLAVFLIKKPQNPLTLIGCIITGLVICILASVMEPRTDAFRMTVLNVGQGQSIILQSDDRTYLVDCGGSYDVDAADLAAETLLSQGIRKVDGLILTHFDRDHAGGAAFFLDRIPADRIYVPSFPDESGILEQLRLLTDKIEIVSAHQEILFEQTEIALYPAVALDSENNGSLAVLFRSDNCDILITGDRDGFGERMLLKTVQIPKLDILVAGHHGSKNSTCEELLTAVEPEIVVISSGRNPYGHPSAQLLERLQRYDCLVYRTDTHGNITFRR